MWPRVSNKVCGADMPSKYLLCRLLTLFYQGKRPLLDTAASELGILRSPKLRSIALQQAFEYNINEPILIFLAQYCVGIRAGR